MSQRLRQAQDGRIIGPELLLDDMAMGFAGLLLMIPGMITDLLALVVMVEQLGTEAVVCSLAQVETEVSGVRELVREEMVGAYPLDPPLAVDVGAGDNWADAK